MCENIISWLLYTQQCFLPVIPLVQYMVKCYNSNWLNCESHVMVCLYGANVFQHLKHWESRKRKKLKEYEREKLKEDEKVKQEEMVWCANSTSIYAHSISSGSTLCYCLTECNELIYHLMATGLVAYMVTNHIYGFVFVRIQSNCYNAQQLSHTQTCLCQLAQACI